MLRLMFLLNGLMIVGCDERADSGASENGAWLEFGEDRSTPDSYGEEASEGSGATGGLGVLGYNTNNIQAVDFRVVGDERDGLNVPRDLAFNPGVPNELWVVNRTDDSMSIFSDVGTGYQASQHIIDPFAMHFMDEVSSIAFGAPMYAATSAYNFATCHESVNTYNGASAGNNFMGPTLWNSHPQIFGQSNPEAISHLSGLFGYYTDLGSHIDMLHESPLCMGIAHDYDNVYWVFDGYNQSIYRYDFQEDHGPGWDDHDDGIMIRFVEDQIAYEPGVPSHMILDPNSRLLFIADTGNNRIAVLDTESGVAGNHLERSEPATTHVEVLGATLVTFIDGYEFGLQAPSGLDLVDGILFVTDNETSEIIAFDMNGKEIDRLDTRLAPGSLMGIAVRSLDDIWLTSATQNRLYRLRPASN